MAGFKSGSLHLRKIDTALPSDPNFIKILVDTSNNLYTVDEFGVYRSIAGYDIISSGSDISVVTSGGTKIISLNNTGVVSGTYGNAVSVPQILIDSKGRILSAYNVPISATGLGTVTSVGVSSTTLSVTNTPITNFGNINVNLSAVGTSGTYTKNVVDSFGRVVSGGYIVATDITDRSTDVTLSANSDNKIPTEHAIKTYTDTKRLYISNGCAEANHPDILDNGNGTITVQQIHARLCSASDFTSSIEEYIVPGTTLSLIDGLEQYICVKYNSGSPIYYVENDKTNINDSNVICIYITWREGNTVHSIGLDSKALGLANKISHSITNSMPYRKSVDGGMILSESSTPTARTVICTSAIVYAGITPTLVLPFNSSTDLLTLYYHSAGAWFGTNQSVYDNTQYDDGSTLQTIGNNKYAVRWFYRSIGDVKQVFYVLGTNKYNTISEAQLEASRGDLPILLRNHCMLVGRIIVQYNANSGLVENVQTTSFIQGVVQNHNDSNNLQGGDGTNYYHLSASTFGYLSAVSADIQDQLNNKGTVNSIGLSAKDSFISISGSPVTSSGIISFGFNEQTSGTFLGGPISGTSAYPIFRKISIKELQYQGTSAQFLKGDGSLDSNSYLQVSSFNTNIAKYLPLSGGALSGTLSGTSIIVSGNVSATNFIGIASSSLSAFQADKLKSSRNFSLSGDVSAISQSFDGSGDVIFSTILSSVGTSGVYTKVQTDSKGRVISGSNLTSADIPSLSGLYLPLSGGRLTGNLSAINISANGSVILPYNPNTLAKNTLMIGSSADFGASNFEIGVGLPSGATHWPFGIMKNGVSLFSIDNLGNAIGTKFTGLLQGYKGVDNGNEMVLANGYAGTGDLYVNPRGSTSAISAYNFNNGLTSNSYAYLKANGFIKNGGTSAQFLKADGTVDSNTYLSVGYLSATLMEPTGFPDITNSTFSFNNSTRVFTISATNGSYDIYYRGTKFTKTSDSVTISNTSGTHFIYFTSAGVLTDSTNAWDIVTTIQVSLVYWNGTSALNLCEERHGCVMDWATHSYLHTTRGTQYINGFNATYTLNNDSSASFGLSSGKIADEDITISITNGVSGSYFTQPLTLPAYIPVYYRSGTDGVGTWKKDNASIYPFKNSGGTSRATYNLLSGGTWSQATITNNNYGAYFIYATNNILEPIISVQSQMDDSSLVNAENNNNPASLNFSDFPDQEMKLLYRLIVKTNNSYIGNPYYVQIVEVTDYRQSTVISNSTGGGTGTVTSVGLTAPTSVFTVSNSPIYNSGNIDLAFNLQSSGTFLGGPISGSNAAPTFRRISATEIVYKGTSAQFLKGDGSLDSNSYAQTSASVSGDLTGNILSPTVIGLVGHPVSIVSPGFLYNNGSTVLSTDLSVSDIPNLSGLYLPLSGGQLTGNLSGLNISANGSVILPYNPNTLAKNTLMIGSSADFGASNFEIGVGLPSGATHWPFGIMKNGVALTTIDISGNMTSTKFTGLLQGSKGVDFSNEMILANGYASTGDLWVNYRGATSGISLYRFGNGLSNAGYASIQANGFIKNGGTSAQFLKADGTVDSNSFGNYLPLSGGTLTGLLKTTNSISAIGNISASTYLGNNIDGTTFVLKSFSDTSNLGSYSTELVSNDGNYVYATVYNGGIFQHRNLLCDDRGNAEVQNILLANGINANFSQITSAYADKIIKNGGTSAQFLKADGTIDSNSYALNSTLGNYLPISGGTLTGNLRISAVPESWAEGIRIMTPANNWGGIRWTRTNSLIGAEDNWALGHAANNTGNLEFDVYTSGSQRTHSTFFKNGNVQFTGNVIGNGFIKNGGTSAQFLLADGSIDLTDRYVQGTGSNFGTRTANLPVTSFAYQNPLKSGFYDCELSDTPNGYWSFLMNVAHNNSYVGHQYQFQIAASFSNEFDNSYGNDDFYVRVINPSGVGAWRKLWNDVNFNPAYYVPLSGNVTRDGNLYFGNNSSLGGTMADNDFWRIYPGNTGSNNGYLEIATADDGTEPIYFRQYNNGFVTPLRTLTLLDATGNSIFPGNISCNIISTTNNGNGTNIYIGDDVLLGDVNTANTLSVKGQQNNTIGYIKFGSNTNTFGYDGSKMTYASNMYYGGNLSANAFVKNGGTAGQMLLANGSVDNVDRFVQGNGTNFGTRTTTLGSGSTEYTQLLKSGFYSSPSTLITPNNNYSYLINTSHYDNYSGNEYQFQIAASFSNDKSNSWGGENYWMRTINAGGVGVWRTLLHDGNFTSYVTGKYLPLSAGSNNALTGELYTNNGIWLNHYDDSSSYSNAVKRIISSNGSAYFGDLELTDTGCGNTQITFHNNVYLGGISYQSDFSTVAYGPSNAIIIQGNSDQSIGGLYFGSTVNGGYYIGRLPGTSYITISSDLFVNGNLNVNQNIITNKCITGNFINNALTTSLDYILDSSTTLVSMVIMIASNKRLYFPPSYNTTYIAGRTVYFFNSSSGDCYLSMQYPNDYFLNLTTNTSPNSVPVGANEMYMCVCINLSPRFWAVSKVG